MPDIETTTDNPWGYVLPGEGAASLNQLADLQRQLRFLVLMNWEPVRTSAQHAPIVDPPDALADLGQRVRANCDAFGQACAEAMALMEAIGQKELDRLVYSGATADLDVLLRRACRHAESVANHWNRDHGPVNPTPIGEQADFIPKLEEWLLRAAAGGKFAAMKAKEADACVGAEALHEDDVAVLAFLNRTPEMRRNVADVIPDSGPQDRKAIGKRLRKLADRRPPLVDYPKGARTGVAILPAGEEALKRATAPTPR